MITERLLPHDLVAEKAVLGAILVSPDALHAAQARLTPASFFRRAHGAMFEAMVTLDQSSTAIDLVTVTAELVRVGMMEEVGGAAYIASLTDGVPRSSNVGHYAEIVRAHALRRELVRTTSDIMARAFDAEERPEALLAAVDRAVLDLQRGTPGRLVDLRDSSAGLVEALEERTRNRHTLTGVSSGFPSIDVETNGWQAGDMIVLAARPSIGKTTLALHFALSAAQHGPVVLFSLEMRRRQLELRLLSMLSGIPLSRILSGFLSEYDYERLAPAMNTLAQRPVLVDDRGSQTIWDIRAACRRVKAEQGLTLVIVDYVQLMEGSLDQKGATRNAELGDISRRLKILADELSCPVVVLSQLNRSGETRSDKRPQLSDLRDTGALEQDADVVAFLHREHHRENGTTEFILGKQRNGPTGTCLLTITRETQTFEDGGVEPVQEPLPEAGPRPVRRRVHTVP